MGIEISEWAFAVHGGDLFDGYETCQEAWEGIRRLMEKNGWQEEDFTEPFPIFSILQMRSKSMKIKDLLDWLDGCGLILTDDDLLNEALADFGENVSLETNISFEPLDKSEEV